MRRINGTGVHNLLVFICFILFTLLAHTMYGDYQSIQEERALLLQRIKPLQHDDRSDWEQVAYEVYVAEYRELTKELKKRDKKQDAMSRELKVLEGIAQTIQEQLTLIGKTVRKIKVTKKIRAWRLVGAKEWHTGTPPKGRVQYKRIPNHHYTEMKKDQDKIKETIRTLKKKLKTTTDRIKTIKDTLWLK